MAMSRLWQCTLMVLVIWCYAAGSQSPDSFEYLTKFGYIENTDGRSSSLVSEEYLKEAIRRFQRMAGLPVTGELDEETEKTMALPRCGVKDSEGVRDKVRRRRFALHGSKWRKTNITYRISTYSRKVSKREVDKEIQRAFDIWSEVIPLKFTRLQYDGYADIDIKFVARAHGDNTPFDGSGQTLAHAYFPQYGGDAHFDEDEQWTVNLPDGVNLFQVAAHEFGHSLGLAHSDVKKALMAPFYRGYAKDFKLDDDDIGAVQELYGSYRRRHEYKPTTRRPIVHIPEICRDAAIDAVTKTDDGITYMFKGDHYYRLNENGVDPGYPRPIDWDWKTVTGPIDAALTWPNGWTFIFKGEYYWKFHNLRFIYGPKNISAGFDGIPSDIDTAFVWSGNGKTYFIKGDRYWRYYGNKKDFGYPRALEKWPGLPNHIDAAFQWTNGRTYFFAGDQYYRYNDYSLNIDSGGYPRDVSSWWLGCPDKSQIQKYDKDNTDGQASYGATSGEADENNEQWQLVDGGVPDSSSGSPRRSCDSVSLLLIVLMLQKAFLDAVGHR